MNINLALIKGDGIGPEIVDEAVKTLDKIAKKFNHSINYTLADAGGIAIDNHGIALPEATVEIAKKADAILLGAVGGPKWDNLSGDERPERALLGLRAKFSLYANLRPAIAHEALKDACPLKESITKNKPIDIMVVRELTGGIYFGEKGRKDSPLGEMGWDTEAYAKEEVRRIAVTAFEIARKRNARVTSVDKANVLESSRVWRETMLEVAKDYKDVALDHMYVDNASMQLIRDPHHFDVIVTTNMFGDILSDEASQLTGSIGMLPSASLNESNFGMYEPIHGSAPDIAGKNIANPIATILSCAMMFRYTFKLEEEAKAIEDAVTRVLDKGFRTVDIAVAGEKCIGTKEMGDLIADEL